MNKKKIMLLCLMDEKINSEIMDDNNLSFIKEGLESFALPKENIIYTYLANKDFKNLQESFKKFYNRMIISFSETIKGGQDDQESHLGCDKDFASYVNLIENKTLEELIDYCFSYLKEIKDKNPDYYHLLTVKTNPWYMGDNWLDGIDGEKNTLVQNRMNLLKNRINDLAWLYNTLPDWLSKASLNAVIKFWLTWDYTDWFDLSLYYCDVVNPQIFSFYNDEVFVDCGAYIGDTVIQYAQTVNDQYKKIFTYDISSENINTTKENLKDLKNVQICYKGLGDKNATIGVIDTDDKSCVHLEFESDNPNKVSNTVEIVRLDEDINEEITFLKVDVEGYDKETLRGAEKLVKQYHPKLTIDCYHKIEDLVEVALLIKEIDPTYTLYFRIPRKYNAQPTFPFPTIMAI